MSQDAQRQYWMLPGNAENWSKALARGVWGFGSRSMHLWRRLQPGDTLFFYVTRPISGVVGLGNAGAKEEALEPLWPNEMDAGEVLYPLRFRLHIEWQLQRGLWEESAVSIKGIPLRVLCAGTVSPDSAEALLERINRHRLRRP